MTSPLEPVAPRVLLIRRLAQSLGFAQLGIAPAEPTHYGDQIEAWLKAGNHGEMKFMDEYLAQRLDPTVLVPGARSIICAADIYPDVPHHVPHIDSGATSNGQSRSEPQLENPTSPTLEGRFARYAWGDDYHRVLKKRLHSLADMLREHFPEHQFLTTVDTAPILEREHAARAGLGWVGKNTMLIHPQSGSWMLLGEIVTTLPLQTTIELEGPTMGDHCGTCTRCIDACPTQCITPRHVDAKRCVSYLTIEHRDVIPTELHSTMGDWIAGCDICQEVCPFNQGEDHVATTPFQREYATRPPGPRMPLIQMLNWTTMDRQKRSNDLLKRIKLDQLKRNVLIAAGNALLIKDNAMLRARVHELTIDANESELVRQTANQVISRLEGSA